MKCEGASGNDSTKLLLGRTVGESLASVLRACRRLRDSFALPSERHRSVRLAVYHIFTRGLDRKYNGAYAQSFIQDMEAIAFARELLEDHLIVEVWRGETFIVELNGKPPALPS